MKLRLQIKRPIFCPILNKLKLFSNRGLGKCKPERGSEGDKK
jgi:hypothetical protein